MRRRRASQPLTAATAGSVFKNPPGHSAGRLIDEAGLKGLSRGEARISLKHANFIENLGRAQAADVLALIAEVQAAVKNFCGIDLEPEVRVVPLV